MGKSCNTFIFNFFFSIMSNPHWCI